MKAAIINATPMIRCNPRRDKLVIGGLDSDEAIVAGMIIHSFVAAMNRDASGLQHGLERGTITAYRILTVASAFTSRVPPHFR